MEFRMKEGDSVPLHTHPTEDAWVVTDGTLTVRIRPWSYRPSPSSASHLAFPTRCATMVALKSALWPVRPWNRATFFTEATTYLEGIPRE